jgi:hypothetical protein
MLFAATLEVTTVQFEAIDPLRDKDSSRLGSLGFVFSSYKGIN